QQLRGNDFGYHSSLSALINFKKKGRNIYFYNILSIGNNDLRQANQSDQYFFNPDFSTKLHQLRQSADKSLSTRNSLRFNEPLSETLNLTSTLDVSYFKGRSALQTFHADQ